MAETLLTLATWYAYAGGAVAAIFLTIGMGQIDENAQEAWIFRPLLIPGVLLIWPLVLWRWWVLHRGENKLDRHLMPRAAQDRVALVFIFAIPLIIGIALISRQNPDSLAAPVLLEPAK